MPWWWGLTTHHHSPPIDWESTVGLCLLQLEKEFSFNSKSSPLASIAIYQNKTHCSGSVDLPRRRASARNIKPNYPVILPPRQHHSFFRNWIMYLIGGLDRYIDRQSYRSKYLAVHRYLTDTWPIFDRYLTVTWPILDRYFTDASPILYIDRYSTDTRPVDKANIKVPAKIRVTSENFLPNSIFYLLQLNWWNVYQLILKG